MDVAQLSRWWRFVRPSPFWTKLSFVGFGRLHAQSRWVLLACFALCACVRVLARPRAPFLLGPPRSNSGITKYKANSYTVDQDNWHGFDKTKHYTDLTGRRLRLPPLLSPG